MKPWNLSVRNVQGGGEEKERETRMDELARINIAFEYVIRKLK